MDPFNVEHDIAFNRAAEGGTFSVTEAHPRRCPPLKQWKNYDRNSYSCNAYYFDHNTNNGQVFRFYTECINVYYTTTKCII